MTSPAESGYQFQKLVDRINLLEQQVGVLMRTQFGSMQKAVVQSFSGGAMVNVQFQASSNVIAVPYLLTWTPGVGQGCVVVDGGGYFLAIPVSAF